MALTFGIDTAAGETPQTVAQRRQMANLIAARMLGTAPKNVGEGLNTIGQALIARSMMGDADAAQKAGMASLPDFLKSQITGQPVTPSAAPSVSAPMGSTSIPSGSIDPRLSSAISTASANSGIDPAYMTRLALVENGGKVEGGSPLSSAQGPFQFLSGTAKQYGLSNPNDPAASADAAARLTLDNKAALTSALGREPTPGELYLAHQQGPAGAIKLLQNPNAPVESVIGAQAARNNAATPGMTAGQFANKWIGKFGDLVQTVDPAQKNIIDAQADGPPMSFAGTPTPMQPVAPQPIAGAAPADPVAGSPASIPPAVQPAMPSQNRFLFKNASDEDIQKALINPFTPENVRAALTTESKLRADAAQKAADPMRALDMQSKTLAIKKAQQDLEKPDETFGVIGQDPNTGKSQYGFINTKTGAVRPYNVPQNGNAPAGSLQEAMKAGVSGDDLYQYLPPDRAKTVKAMIEGRMPPPSTTAMRSPATMQLIDAANAIDPGFDATTWKSRSTFNQQFGSQAPSSIGGQKVLMGTALGHLGEVADSAAKLDNVNGLGIAKVGHLANYVKNQTTDQAAIANALEDKVAKFSGEVGKLYSGSQGGGVHEREDTRNRLGSNLTAAELAAGLEASKDLILSKQKALADQASTIFGPEKSQKFDFIGPEGRDAIAKIDNAIAKLRGQAPADTASAAPTANGQRKTSTGISWSIQ
jgi:hypothetical protein